MNYHSVTKTASSKRTGVCMQENAKERATLVNRKVEYLGKCVMELKREIRVLDPELHNIWLYDYRSA